jgi:hypothetical protein
VISSPHSDLSERAGAREELSEVRSERRGEMSSGVETTFVRLSVLADFGSLCGRRLPVLRDGALFCGLRVPADEGEHIVGARRGYQSQQRHQQVRRPLARQRRARNKTASVV